MLETTPSIRPQTTGRHIVVLAEGAPEQQTAVLESAAGLREVTPCRDYGPEPAAATRYDTLFDRLGIAVVDADPDQVTALRAAEGEGGIVAVVPELIHHVLAEHTPADYVRGYADGVADLAARLGVEAPEEPGEIPSADPPFADSDALTWGLQAIGIEDAAATGAGIAVAVLDTGMDLAHPDFAGRDITGMSFVDGEEVQDGHGHGTHCIGTALGPASPASGPRYGVAPGAAIFAGKVLGDEGSGSDGGILAGIDWAISSGCAIVSLSLGADVPEVHPPYVTAGRRALDQGVLIIAAAGNNASRSEGDMGFVGTPANSPSVLAVAALDQRLAIADFSARTLPAVHGGQVDLAAPGVDVHSAWPMPTQLRTISGTSMATPHVAGLAALWAELTGLRGRELWATLVEYGTRLEIPSVDVGAGLAIAPGPWAVPGRA